MSPPSLTESPESSSIAIPLIGKPFVPSNKAKEIGLVNRLLLPSITKLYPALLRDRLGLA